MEFRGRVLAVLVPERLTHAVGGPRSLALRWMASDGPPLSSEERQGATRRQRFVSPVCRAFGPLRVPAPSAAPRRALS